MEREGEGEREREGERGREREGEEGRERVRESERERGGAERGGGQKESKLYLTTVIYSIQIAFQMRRER